MDELNLNSDGDAVIQNPEFTVRTAARRQSALLALGEVSWSSPLRLMLLSAICLGPISYYLDTPILTALMFAYQLGITNYLIQKQKTELHRLRPAISCDDDTFNAVTHALSHHPRSLLNAAWIIGPILTVAVNFEGPGVAQIRDGDPITLQLVWAMSLAMIFWVSLSQMIVIFVGNSLMFSRVGALLAKIDLLDITSLVPFARVGIRNLLIFVGGYSLIPLIYVDGTIYLQAVFLSLAITLPIALFLLVLPMYSIRVRIGQAKDEELSRIQQAMHGNRSALAQSPISRDAQNIGFTGLVLYRQLIQEINEWPVDNPVFLRLSLYIVIPLLTWFGAALVEKLVDLVL